MCFFLYSSGDVPFRIRPRQNVAWLHYQFTGQIATSTKVVLIFESSQGHIAKLCVCVSVYYLSILVQKKKKNSPNLYAPIWCYTFETCFEIFCIDGPIRKTDKHYRLNKFLLLRVVLTMFCKVFVYKCIFVVGNCIIFSLV